jgi:hypothetical protein
MKIKLSKSQWEEMGKKAGWFKEQSVTSKTDKNDPNFKQKKEQSVTSKIDKNDPNFKQKIEDAYFRGWESKEEHIKGEWMMLNPEIKKFPIGRAFWRGWKDCSPHKPKVIPDDLADFALSNSPIKF